MTNPLATYEGDITSPASLPQCPIRTVTCQGSPLKMGIAQGEAYREEIRQSLDVLADLEAVRLLKPKVVPHRLFLRIAEHKADWFLKSIFTRVPVSARERLQGIAAGANVPLRRLALCSAMEAVLSDLTKVTAPAVSAGCTAIALTGSASRNGDPILAHNFDYLPVLQPFYFIRRTLPAQGLRSVELALMPLPGAVDGVNEAGLAITCNYAYAVDAGTPGPTITMLIAEALSRCRTVEEVCDWFQSTPRVGGGLLMLGDAAGTIAAVEISNSTVKVREPVTDRLSHTNRYCHPDMARFELDATSTHGARSPASLRGGRVHHSSDVRSRRLTRLLHNNTFDVEDVRQMMSDHGEDGTPTSDTVCMHGNYWHTTASIQLLPSTRRLRASFSPTCVADYQDFDVTAPLQEERVPQLMASLV
jgi:hypothetical protein